MSTLLFSAKLAFVVAGFGVGIVIGATVGTIRNYLAPAQYKVHYCYPNSKDEICRKSLEAPLVRPEATVAAREH